MTIEKVFIDHILFSDGSILVALHEQECCEHTYADFCQLEDEAKTHRFLRPILIETCKGGFRFGDTRRKFFVPCYSVQNGYYSNRLEVFMVSDGVKFQFQRVNCDIYDEINGNLLRNGE